MADADYRAWVEVLPSFDKFNDTVQTVVIGGMGSAGVQGSGAMGAGLLAGIPKLAAPILGALAALGIGAAITDQVQAGFDAAVGYIEESVLAAADLEQSVGAVQAIFKDSAPEVLAWGEAASESVGLSRNSYYEFASIVGAQLKNLGIPLSEVSGQTDELIRLGADLSAQFGGSTSDAVAALSSLLRGERDPIERYGVSIKQADINARVAAMGLGELTLEEERQAQILATLDILNEQTADAQGTFARENETFLNVQQRMNAEIEDTAAAFGEQLLPIITELMNFAKDELLPMWVEFNEEAGPRLREALEEAMPHLLDLAERILPLIPPALTAVIDSLVWVANTIDGNIRWWSLIIGIIQDFFGLLTGDTSIDDFVGHFQERLGSWREVADARIGEVVALFTRLGDQLGSIISKIGENFYRSGRQLVQRLIDGIRSMLGNAGNAASSIMSHIAGFFPHSPAERGPFSGAGWTAVRDAGAAIMSQFQAGLSPVDVPLSASLAGAAMSTPGGLSERSLSVRFTPDLSLFEQMWAEMERRAQRGIQVQVGMSGRAGRTVL